MKRYFKCTNDYYDIFKKGRIYSTYKDEYYGWKFCKTEITEGHWIANDVVDNYFVETIPEKWCVAVTEENKEILENWRTDHTIGPDKGYVLYPGYKSKIGWFAINKPEGVTEITFEQFKKYVLNQKEEMKKKELIGYRLIKQEYSAAGLVIAGDSAWKAPRPCHITNDCIAVDRLKEAGVLDLWFEPVYREEEIIIRNYAAEIRGDHVKFGCRKYSKGFVLELDECLFDNNFKLMDKDTCLNDAVKNIAYRFKT